MRLNTLSPAIGSKFKARRVGRGQGSGLGKTCGRGHKGQTSRTGGYRKVGFEGGQMPLHRRLPKFGFISRKSLVRDEIRLDELAKVQNGEITLDSLKAANLISSTVKFVKVILSGKLEKAVTLKGVGVTKGAREAIIAAGGKVE